MAMLFYGAYLALRESVEDPDARARWRRPTPCSGWSWRRSSISWCRASPSRCTPTRWSTRAGKIDVESRMLQVLLLGSIGFNVLYFLDAQSAVPRGGARRAARSRGGEVVIEGGIGWVAAVNVNRLDRALPLPAAPARAGQGSGKRRGQAMKHKRLYLIGAVLLLAFAGFSLASFNKALTPLRQLRAGAQRRPHGADRRRAREGQLELRHDGRDARLHARRPGRQVQHAGVVQRAPAGELRGRDQHRGDRQLGPEQKRLHADKLLVKCPSKYQGAEVKTYS
jgi:hypothetical protein